MPNTRLNAKRNEMSELNPQTTAISRIGMRQTALRKCVKLPRENASNCPVELAA